VRDGERVTGGRGRGRASCGRRPGLILARFLVGGAALWMLGPAAAEARPGAFVSLSGPASGAAEETQPSELERVATRFTEALEQGDVDQMARLLSEQGIRLRLQGLDRSALSVRQAQAALRDFLRGYEPGAAHMVRAAPVAGSPGRGFAEVRWQTRVAGTSHPAVHSVFLGLVRGEGGWRVDELRLLP
jgi:hypothetical protein